MGRHALTTCTNCDTAKPASDFNKCKARKNGLQGWCRDCEKSRIKNPETIKRNWVRRSYGITVEEYDRQMATSDDCQICGSTDRLVYDHCHVSGDFRGVLCHTCNLAIGHLGDDLDGLRRAFNYLSNHYSGE